MSYDRNKKSTISQATSRKDGDKSDGYEKVARMMYKSMANPLEFNYFMYVTIREIGGEQSC